MFVLSVVEAFKDRLNKVNDEDDEAVVVVVAVMTVVEVAFAKSKVSRSSLGLAFLINSTPPAG